MITHQYGMNTGTGIIPDKVIIPDDAGLPYFVIENISLSSNIFSKCGRSIAYLLY